MLTEYDAKAAADNRSIVATDDGRTGQVVGYGVDGDNILLRLISDKVSDWFDINTLNPTADLAKCGRCNAIVPTADIDTTGPYLTCPPCTTIVRS